MLADRSPRPFALAIAGLQNKSKEVDDDVVIVEAGDVTISNSRTVTRWTRKMDIALCTQIVDAGHKAWVTTKANTPGMKDEEKWDQKKAWTNEEDGILTMLWGAKGVEGHSAFKGVPKPEYQSAINHLTKSPHGLLCKSESPRVAQRAARSSHTQRSLLLAAARRRAKASLNCLC